MISGDVISDHIIEIFSQYGLNEAEVKEQVLFVSDRGSNFKYGLINNGFKRLTCYAHIIHNLVCEMLKNETVREHLKLCITLCNYFKNSGLNAQMSKSLKAFVPTRWNSIFLMLNSIIEMYDEILGLLAKKQKAINEYRAKNGKKTKTH